MTAVNPGSLADFVSKWEEANPAQKIGRKFGNYLVCDAKNELSVKHLNIFQQFLRNYLSCFGFYRETRLANLGTRSTEILESNSKNPTVAKIKQTFLLKSAFAGLAQNQNYLATIRRLVDAIPMHKAKITTFGVGTRTVYPKSEWTDKLLKGGQKIDLTGYTPVPFTADVVKNSVWAPGKDPKNAWADPQDPAEIAGQIAQGRNRVTGDYKAQTNPMGLTGITGQGELGLHGPNPAADPIVFTVIEGRLMVLLVQREDTQDWAIPGGMLDPTDKHISAAATRELQEETSMPYDILKARGDVVDLGEVYEGYSDDRRNTDTSWMTTTAYGYLVNALALKKIKLKAGDDAIAQKWVDVEEVLNGSLKLFASHAPFVCDAVRNFLNKQKTV